MDNVNSSKKPNKVKKDSSLQQQALWNNDDNREFYEKLAAEGLQEFAKKGGFANSYDLVQLEPYWSKAISILEVGAGYGRVISYLLNHNFSGKITAIERCNASFNSLKEQFCNYPNVKLVQDDINNCDKITEKFDLILFLWSGLVDFSEKEQPIIFKKLASLLNKKGFLVVDSIPSHVMSLSSIEIGKQQLYFELDNLSAYGYMPTIDQIKLYGEQANLHNLKTISFKTEINRERLLHILS